MKRLSIQTDENGVISSRWRQDLPIINLNINFVNRIYSTIIRIGEQTEGFCPFSSSSGGFLSRKVPAQAGSGGFVEEGREDFCDVRRKQNLRVPVQVGGRPVGDDHARAVTGGDPGQVGGGIDLE